MKRLLYTFAALMLGLMCSCSKDNVPEENSSIIRLMPIIGKDDVLTRASLFQNDDNLKSVSLHAYAYLAGTTTRYFDSYAHYSTADVDYTKHRWLFYSQMSGGSISYHNYYWPLVDQLDFFAYAPVDNGYVVVQETNPPKFTATMPLTNVHSGLDQEDMMEFIFAYSPDKDKSAGAVTLDFKHPFAAIMFKVEKSHRDLTVNTITVDGVKYIGTCSVSRNTPDVPSWSLDGAEGSMDLTIGKIIPGDVNFGGDLCPPYLVIPQTNSGADKKTVTIEFHWDGTADDNWHPTGKNNTYTVSGPISNDWSAGKIYTYSLDLGDSREEILFEVSVTDWDFVYDHVFEIE